MGTAFVWMAVLLLPTALGWAVIGAVRMFRWVSARRHRSSPPPEPIERLSADLCRLHAALETAENQPALPFKAARVRALRGAYVDVLSDACQRLEVSPPTVTGASRVPLTEIYRAEAALRERGLDVRPPVAR